MDFKEYQKKVFTTEKAFSTREIELTVWGLGITGEAGDVAGCIKKTLYHDNDQVAGIRENLGDTLWYIAAICNHFNWSLEEVASENVIKLLQRYPKGFTETNARRGGTRKDWMEDTTVTQPVLDPDHSHNKHARPKSVRMTEEEWRSIMKEDLE